MEEIVSQAFVRATTMVVGCPQVVMEEVVCSCFVLLWRKLLGLPSMAAYYHMDRNKNLRSTLKSNFAIEKLDTNYLYERIEDDEQPAPLLPQVESSSDEKKMEHEKNRRMKERHACCVPTYCTHFNS
jgi:hypothetical protein